MSLTDKQKAFVVAYVKCRNATLAAQNAGYSKKTAYSQGARLLHNPEIKAEIEKVAKKVFKEAKYTVENAISELNIALQQALITVKPTAAVSAIMAKAKLAGLLDRDREDDENVAPFEVVIRK